GRAVPQVIGRHAHPRAPPDEDPEPVTCTGIDYLALIAGAGQPARGEQLRLASIADAGDGPGAGLRDEDSQGQDQQGEGEQEARRRTPPPPPPASWPACSTTPPTACAPTSPRSC